MKVLHAAAEIFPLIKTGGLADVVGALPEALTAQGAQVRLVLPGLPAIMKGVERQKVVCELGAIFGAGRVTLKLGRLVHNQVAAYVIDAPYLYQRPGNPYHGPDGNEWPDNLQRFGLLGWVAAHLAAGELDSRWTPDVLHLHDWHTAMACAYAACHPATRAATIYTVHNLAYQGLFDEDDFHLLGLPARLLVPSGLEFHAQLSFMKAGLKYARRITTVSPSYAREIATDDFGCGLDGVIRARGAAVSGILNGVDGAVWNPAADAQIAAPYSADALEGKARCKAALQQELGLNVDAGAPLFTVVSRLTAQKGLDLVLDALPALLKGYGERHAPGGTQQAEGGFELNQGGAELASGGVELAPGGAQLAVLGNGSPALEAAFSAAAAAHPGRVAVRLAYDEALAHRMMAGADAIVVPSRFEPCGLTQLYALRYGTVPVVRQVGGLADTVVNATDAALQGDTATGFTFGPATSEALAGALRQAVDAYRHGALWRQLMRRGMAQNFSWATAASQYMALYRQALQEVSAAS